MGELCCELGFVSWIDNRIQERCPRSAHFGFKRWNPFQVIPFLLTLECNVRELLVHLGLPFLLPCGQAPSASEAVWQVVSREDVGQFASVALRPFIPYQEVAHLAVAEQERVVAMRAPWSLTVEVAMSG